MLDCLITGDSIANNIADFMPECARYAIGGINSWQYNHERWVAKVIPQRLDAKTVVISLGSNFNGIYSEERELRAARARVNAERVIWIIPAIKPPVQALVRKVAGEHGDLTLTIPYLQRDGIHPSWKGCEKLRDDIRGLMVRPRPSR